MFASPATAERTLGFEFSLIAVSAWEMANTASVRALSRFSNSRAGSSASKVASTAIAHCRAAILKRRCSWRFSQVNASISVVWRSTSPPAPASP